MHIAASLRLWYFYRQPALLPYFIFRKLVECLCCASCTEKNPQGSTPHVTGPRASHLRIKSFIDVASQTQTAPCSRKSEFKVPGTHIFDLQLHFDPTQAFCTPDWLPASAGHGQDRWSCSTPQNEAYKSKLGTIICQQPSRLWLTFNLQYSPKQPVEGQVLRAARSAPEAPGDIPGLRAFH